MVTWQRQKHPSTFGTREGSVYPYFVRPSTVICMSTERPEALDKGSFVLSGIDIVRVLSSMDVAVSLVFGGQLGVLMPNYNDEIVSTREMRII